MALLERAIRTVPRVTRLDIAQKKKEKNILHMHVHPPTRLRPRLKIMHWLGCGASRAAVRHRRRRRNDNDEFRCVCNTCSRNSGARMGPARRRVKVR